MSSGYDDDSRVAFNVTFWIGVAIVMVLLIGAVVFALWRPIDLRLETQANRNSQQFVDSKVTHLQNLYADYLRLDQEIADFGSDPLYSHWLFFVLNL